MRADERDDGLGQDLAENPFDLREKVLYALLRYWPLLVGGIGLGTLAGLAFAWSKPDEYVSVGKIHLKLSGVEQRTLDSVLLDGQPGNAHTTGMNDELELLRNPAVHERVARALGVERVLQPYDPSALDTPRTSAPLRWLHRARSWWFARISPTSDPLFDPRSEWAVAVAAREAEASAVIEAVPRSNIILVAYRSHDPELSRECVDAYLDVAGQWHRESFATNYQRDFLEEEYRKRRAELDRAHAALVEHLSSCKVDDLELVQAGLIAQHVELERGIEESRVRLGVLEEELRSIELMLGEAEPTVEDPVPPDAPDPSRDPAYQSALAELARLHRERAELEDYVDTSELYLRRRQRLERMIGEQEARLAELEQLAASEPRARRVVNPLLEELASQRVDRIRERDGLRSAIDGNVERLARLRQRLDRTLMCVKVHHLMELDLEAAEAGVREYGSQLQKEVILDTVTDQERMSSLTVIQRGTLPVTREGPRRAKYVLGGLFAGGILAALVAILLQSLDPRVRYGGGLQRDLGVEVVAVVPEQRELRRLGLLRGRSRVSP